ncbi:MAG: nucleotidyltransferase domain-containing protein [Thermoleophilia bacterium]
MAGQHREHELITEAAKSLLRDFSPDRIEGLIADTVDWAYVLKTAGKHGIAPLLYSMLSRSRLNGRIPADVFGSLRASYLTSLMKNKKLYQSLAVAYDRFSSESIELMLLKGGALGVNTYDDFGLRPFSDIDILVKKTHVPRCRELMESARFKVVLDAYWPVPDELNDELGCEWTYISEDSSVIELHWDLMPKITPFKLLPELYWEDAVPAEFEGRRALAMCPEDQLIHLCLHQFKHHWEHLRDLADVALVIDRHGDTIDWLKLCERSSQQHVERCVLHTLSLTRRILDITIPEAAFEELGRHYRAGVMARSLEDLIAANLLVNNMPRRFWELILVRGLRNRANIIRDILAHPFPRKGDPEPFGKQKSHTFKGKLRAVFQSLFYYRRILTAYPRHFIKTLTRKRG